MGAEVGGVRGFFYLVGRGFLIGGFFGGMVGEGKF